MRDEDVLRAIAKQWAYDKLESWQYEYGAWDYVVENEELTDEELEFCQGVAFKISVK